MRTKTGNLFLIELFPSIRYNSTIYYETNTIQGYYNLSFFNFSSSLNQIINCTMFFIDSYIYSCNKYDVLKLGSSSKIDMFESRV